MRFLRRASTIVQYFIICCHLCCIILKDIGFYYRLKARILFLPNCTRRLVPEILLRKVRTRIPGDYPRTPCCLAVSSFCRVPVVFMVSLFSSRASNFLLHPIFYFIQFSTSSNFLFIPFSTSSSAFLLHPLFFFLIPFYTS